MMRQWRKQDARLSLLSCSALHTPLNCVLSRAVSPTLQHGETLYVANAGDSRGVLCRGTEALALSEDHKPASDRERNRIIAAGGFLSEIGGVCRCVCVCLCLFVGVPVCAGVVSVGSLASCLLVLKGIACEGKRANGLKEAMHLLTHANTC